MEQMTRMNCHMDEIQDFIKTNVQLITDNKKSKQVSFSDQLPSQTIAKLRNQRATSSQMHNVNHIHIDDESAEMTLAISSFLTGKDLPYPYNDHPFHQGTIDEEIQIVVVEQDNHSVITRNLNMIKHDY